KRKKRNQASAPLTAAKPSQGSSRSRRRHKMDSLRLAPSQSRPAATACCRCANPKRHWDRIAGKPYCPECQEALVLGLAAPLTERTEKKACAACGRTGTVCYLTYPLQTTTPVEMDLCPEHLRALLGRRLGPYAFHQLRRRLHVL